jgi:hypothetical protein
VEERDTEGVHCATWAMRSHFFAEVCGAEGGVEVFLSFEALVDVDVVLSSPKPRFRIESGAMRFLYLHVSLVV